MGFIRARLTVSLSGKIPWQPYFCLLENGIVSSAICSDTGGEASSLVVRWVGAAGPALSAEGAGEISSVTLDSLSPCHPELQMSDMSSPGEGPLLQALWR